MIKYFLQNKIFFTKKKDIGNYWRIIHFAIIFDRQSEIDRQSEAEPSKATDENCA